MREEHLGIVQDTTGKEGPEAGTVRDQGGCEGISMEKEDMKGDKNDKLCANRLLVSTLLWPCPVPDHHSLSCLLIKLHL